MNLRVIKSLATPSCSLVFAPAMGISTSSDFGRVETSNEHNIYQPSLPSSSHHHPPPSQPPSSSDLFHQPASSSSSSDLNHHHLHHHIMHPPPGQSNKYPYIRVVNATSNSPRLNEPLCLYLLSDGCRDMTCTLLH